MSNRDEHVKDIRMSAPASSACYRAEQIRASENHRVTEGNYFVFCFGCVRPGINLDSLYNSAERASPAELSR